MIHEGGGRTKRGGIGGSSLKRCGGREPLRKPFFGTRKAGKTVVAVREARGMRAEPSIFRKARGKVAVKKRYFVWHEECNLTRVREAFHWKEKKGGEKKKKRGKKEGRYERVKSLQTIKGKGLSYGSAKG